MKEKINKINYRDVETLIENLRSKDVLNVLRSSGKPRNPEDQPVLEMILNDTGLHPYTVDYCDLYIDLKSFLTLMETMGELVISNKALDMISEILTPETSVYRIQKGYFVYARRVWSNLDEYVPSQRKMLEENSYTRGGATVVSPVLYTPPKSSSFYDEKLEQNLHEVFMKMKLKKPEDVPFIGMICKDREFYIRDFQIKGDYTVDDVDLHYGDGFQNFHDQLVDRFKNDTKGLVLLHGEPGTGKTHYVRYLMKEMCLFNKKVIYFPSNVVNLLLSPDLIPFLTSTMLEYSTQGSSCILLIEDAEPLLVSRTSGRSEGITNLLNITDGILNDILNVQVIATFNTDLKNIDTALLRPERLIARKEFKKLSKENSKKLCEKLGVNFQGKEESLAEIYAKKKKAETLIHECGNVTESKIGF